MAITAFPFDSQVTGTDSLGLPIYDNVYTSENMRDLLEGITGDGVRGLAVTPAGEMNLRVAPGAAVGGGTAVVSDAVQVLTVPQTTAAMTYTVVVRMDVANRKAVIALKAGKKYTEPELTRTAETWELGLARVQVSANATALAASNITDERADSDRCGSLTADKGGLHTGRDLSVVLADEIPSGGDVWDALHARCDAGNFDGLFVGDYAHLYLKDVSATTSTYQKFVIADFDPYKNATPSYVDNHTIYFVAMEPVSVTPSYESEAVVGNFIKWNTDAFNNGMSTDKHPYALSDLALWEDVYAASFPDNVSANMFSFRYAAEERFDSSKVVTSSTGWSYIDVGRKCWSLTEVEVFGHTIWGTKGHSVGVSCQLELFRRAKDRNGSSSTTPFWLQTVADGDSTSACVVDNYRSCTTKTTNTSGVKPRPCFMLK